MARPWKRPTKNALIKLVDRNLTVDEIAVLLSVSVGSISNWMNQYGLKRASQVEIRNLKAKQRYGVDSTGDIPGSRNNIRKGWKKKTPEDINSITSKRATTCLVKYGKKFFAQTEEYKEKSKITSLRNWGC